MMKHTAHTVILLLTILLAGSPAMAQDVPARTSERWIYLQTNLLPDKNVEEALALIARTAMEGYNGVLLTDSKFMGWDKQPPSYIANVTKVREACRDHKMKVIAGVMPIGYSNELLGRDPNLAEGLPVKDAPFIARGGRLVPDPGDTRLDNGGFEKFRGEMPAGWDFADQPGNISFRDTETVHGGKSSLRMQDVEKFEPDHRHARVCQKLKVRPFQYYHVSVAVKTRDWVSGDTRIAVLGAGNVSLNYYTPKLEKTQDWRVVDVTFNSLDNDEVRLYLGTWAGKTGTIWWDDVRVEPAGLVNVLRREGAPFRVTSDDGATVYVEGRDFDGARDPKLGVDPYAGEYSAWHEMPAMTLPAGSRIRDGDRVRVSYYHPELIHEGAVPCCMSEEKVYDILKWQVEQVAKHVRPDGYMMNHDEIRIQGWDASCEKRNLTPGQILATNVFRCADIIRKADPGKPIHVWSDMFDPRHNALPTGRYYLVKGEGPWSGSWEGLPRDVVVMNWHLNPKGRVESLKHFADRGHRQILAGYYDADPSRIRDWLNDAGKVEGVIGVMYTTWEHNFTQTQPFLDAAR